MSSRNAHSERGEERNRVPSQHITITADRDEVSVRCNQYRVRVIRSGWAMFVLLTLLCSVPAAVSLAVDEGFESGDLRTWQWSIQMPGGTGWTVTQRKQHSGAYSVRAGRAALIYGPSKLWVNLQVREGYIHFYAKVKKGHTLWFTVCEPRSEHMWYSGRDCIVKKISAAPGWQEIEVWVPSGYWHFQWENRSEYSSLIWIDDITFAETSASLQAEKKRADTLFQEGTTAAINDDYDTAIKSLTAALQMYRDIGNPRGGARCLDVLGFTYSEHGYLYEAVKLYRQALALYQSFFDCPGMTKSLSKEGVARLQYVLGSAYIGLGAYDQAIEHLNQSLAVWTKMLEGNLTTDMIADLLSNASGQNATCLRRLAAAYLWVGEREQALVYLEMSLEIFKRINSTNGEVACLLGLADYSLGEGDHMRALDHAKEAMSLAEPLNDRSLKATCLRMLGLCNEKLSQYEKAIGYYEQTLEISRSIGDRDGILMAQWCLGRTHRKVGHLDQAKSFYEEAIAILEKTRSGIEEEGLRESFFSKFRALYEGYLDLLLEMGEKEDTVLVAERCRARTFLDLLAMGPVGTLENVAEEGIRSGVIDTSVIEKDLAEVMAGLPEDTAVLEYFVTEETVYLWVVTQDGVSEPIPIEIGREVLIDRVISFRKMLETPPTGGVATANLELLSAARDLFDLLIGPVEENIVGFSHLVIVPSGPLYYLPFSALYRCPGCAGRDLFGGEFLVERFALSYAPSLTTLKYAQAIGAQTYPEPTFLGLADPDSGDSTIHRLPDARKEAESIAALFLRSEVYVDRQATEEVVQSCSATAREILFSTHGHFDPLNPMLSYLLLSPTEGNDGKLHAHEIFSLPLRANMVVLSACETLLPSLAQMTDQLNKIARRAGDDTPKELTEDQLKELTAGDEVVGLTRAFISAGASSVLSSLWSVPSGSTAALMVAFYGHLNEGLSKAEALRQAQIDVKEVYPHPWYWAAFVQYGDWR